MTGIAGDAQKERFAYVFYATSDDYAISALLAVNQLKRLGARPDIEFVAHTLSVSEPIIARMLAAGVRVKRVEPLPRAHGWYFRHCLTKLRIFELTEYSRVVHLDADAVPLANLDHLFSLPSGIDVAAPRAYWLEQPTVTTLLLVATPRQDLWRRVEQHFASSRRSRRYDMEIINLEFGRELHVLPDEYACLDSEWEQIESPFRFGQTTERAHIIHFTALGKPWSYHPAEVRRRRPDAHPMFYELRDRWWAARNELFPELAQLSPNTVRMKRLLNRISGRLEPTGWLQARLARRSVRQRRP